MERIIKPIFWTTRSVKDLEKITRFNSKLYGFEKAIEIALEIRKHTEVLESIDSDFSKIGSIDATFSHLKRNYRKLIFNYCKITYREGNDKVFINRVFDTRQNPNKNK
ncbi:type II toxin-antitoxin system RelE/ParE family toxin [Flavobacterium sp. SUN052]|uniref:type II toxin-antitoxin system RelE/ParE family toxin n=1 Tax=Flavobacterium sp. SUN052 TaxID=3002441 RepID=UPI00237DEEBB|nr:type II toxin-antitoxin system RelE/ParE family toxin [Flavobacterium sp. SUN052]MEC4005445.1 type II toxin-antitoxin system RelE/ParE family toxin [Flavobacterium sp. SUN052]